MAEEYLGGSSIELKAIEEECLSTTETVMKIQHEVKQENLGENTNEIVEKHSRVSHLVKKEPCNVNTDSKLNGREGNPKRKFSLNARKKSRVEFHVAPHVVPVEDVKSTSEILTESANVGRSSTAHVKARQSFSGKLKQS